MINFLKMLLKSIAIVCMALFVIYFIFAGAAYSAIIFSTGMAGAIWLFAMLVAFIMFMFGMAQEEKWFYKTITRYGMAFLNW